MSNLDGAIQALESANKKAFPTNSMNALEALSNLSQTTVNNIYRKIGDSILTPQVQAFQKSHYRESGIETGTGAMLDALSKVKVVAGKKGWLIVLPPGLQEKEYIKLSIAKYGGLRGKAVEGIESATRRKQLKTVVKKANGAGGAFYQKPHHPIMDISKQEVDSMGPSENQALRDSLAKMGIK